MSTFYYLLPRHSFTEVELTADLAYDDRLYYVARGFTGCELTEEQATFHDLETAVQQLFHRKSVPATGTIQRWLEKRPGRSFIVTTQDGAGVHITIGEEQCVVYLGGKNSLNSYNLALRALKNV